MNKKQGNNCTHKPTLRDRNRPWSQRPAPTVFVDDRQRVALVSLWFKYGNNGPCHTRGNHKFIQGILERGRDFRAYYAHDITSKCIEDVDRIISDIRQD